MTVGRFTVHISIRPDNPAFPVYVVMADGLVIGRQFSMPSQSDCEWLERQSVYATSSTWLERSNARRRRQAGYRTAATTRQKHKAA